MIIDNGDLLSVYQSNPTLCIYDGVVGFPEPGDELLSVKSVSREEAFIAYRSLALALAELVAREKLPGLSAESMIMRNEYIKEAERMLSAYIKEGNGDELFKKWVDAVLASIQELAKAEPDLKTEDALMRIAERYRIPHVLLVKLVAARIAP